MGKDFANYGETALTDDIDLGRLLRSRFMSNIGHTIEGQTNGTLYRDVGDNIALVMRDNSYQGCAELLETIAQKASAKEKVGVQKITKDNNTHSIILMGDMKNIIEGVKEALGDDDLGYCSRLGQRYEEAKMRLQGIREKYAGEEMER